jgi:hypothetical protein
MVNTTIQEEQKLERVELEPEQRALPNGPLITWRTYSQS